MTHRPKKNCEATLSLITFFTLYNGTKEDIFSNVDGPISTGVQPKQLGTGKTQVLANFITAVLVTYVPLNNRTVNTTTT
jgi:hypothetical protein